MDDFITLDTMDLIWSSGLIAMAIVLSNWQKLELEGQLILAAGRSLLQLLVVSSVLLVIFELDNPVAVLVILGIMLTIAAIAANNRMTHHKHSLFPVVLRALLVSSVLTLSYSLIVIIRPDVWYSPQYLIPLTGMILGNSMNSASLTGERLGSMIAQNRLEVETHLCLGATPKQAIASYRKEAIRIGLIPTLNQMMVVGIVSLPGMFTGQVLAGIDPLTAASYQILILFMIVFSNLLTVILVTEGVYRNFFNSQAQLIL